MTKINRVKQRLQAGERALVCWLHLSSPLAAEIVAQAGYDGVLEAGMTICVESYIGRDGGTEGVKLEEQVLITESGTEVLSEFPFEESLLAG